MSSTSAAESIAPAGFADLIRPLNETITPLVKAGVAAPFLNPFGLVVLEIPGRKSGRRYTLPLVCWSFHDAVVVSTVRTDSQWIRNLDAADKVTIWLRGRRREATATVIANVGLSVAVLTVQ